MKCQYCGTENAAGSTFCQNCGQPFNDNTNTFSNAPGKNSVSSIFSDPNEVPVATLGNGVALNYLAGEGLKRERAIVTNKRLYYNNKRGIVNIVSQEEKIDLEDITATKICNNNPILLLIIAGVFATIGTILLVNLYDLFGSSNYVSVGFPSVVFLFLISVIMLITYFATHKKYIRIEYAGGFIRLSLIGYKMENIRAFQNAIYIQKDKLKSNR